MKASLDDGGSGGARGVDAVALETRDVVEAGAEASVQLEEPVVSEHDVEGHGPEQSVVTDLTQPAPWFTFGAVLRPVTILLAAMELTRPGMPKAEATRYAAALNRVGLERQIDPLMAVAIVHFESHWLPGQISEDGEDYGLGQVRARYQLGCRDDVDPLNAPSESCQRAKAALLEGVENIRQMGNVIKANQLFCKKHLGAKALAAAGDSAWLAGYQGYGSPEHWCQGGDKTKQVIAYHGELLERLGLKKKAPPPKASKPAAKPGASKPAARPETRPEASKPANRPAESKPADRPTVHDRPVARHDAGHPRVTAKR